MIYIHVPFCRSFCTYCGFYSEIVSRQYSGKDDQSEVFQKYTDRLCKEIRDREQEIRVSLQSGVDTLYFGGGTPSVLPLESFKRIIDTLTSVGVSPSFEEFTIEMNPEDVIQKGESFILSLVELGLNRVSMGVQSFDNGLLKWMNRRHTAEGAEEAVSILRNAGVQNISLDLIFGISHLSNSMWTDTIDKTISLGPEHISAYQLSIEDGSALSKLIDRGQYTEADEEMCLNQYKILCEKLGDAGYRHYEVSNFALQGKHARHNSAYWKHVPYVGLGPGAHSFDGEHRSWNSETCSSWAREFETLSDEDIKVEKIMLALRTSDGIEKDYLFSVCDKALVQSMIASGSLSYINEDRIRIPEDKFFASDSIIRELI